MFSSNTSQQSEGYQIQRSLRFNSADSAYLNRTPASAGNRKTWTWSGWVKKSLPTGNQQLFAVRPDASNLTSFYFFVTGETFRFVSSGTSIATLDLVTTQVFRDPSAWYHIVIALDTTQATASNRAKIYVNGTQVTAFTTETYPAQNSETLINSTNGHRIGAQDIYGNYLDGYMTEVNFIDGQALTPSSFGQTNANTGVWEPKPYAGTYGTNGFYLNFSDNSNTTATTLGKDYSGNGNNWTPNNFSVSAGAGNDSLVDVPTPYGTDTGVGGTVRGNYCTLNPLSVGSVGLSNGNLSWANTTNNQGCIGTIETTVTGKWYVEFTVDYLAGGYELYVGVNTSVANLADGNRGSLTTAYAYAAINGNKLLDNSGSAYGASYTTNDVIGIALDKDNNTLTFYKNGVSQGQIASVPSSKTMFWAGGGGGSAANSYGGTFNFGQRPFAYTAPSGFKALCTQNLPTPTVGATATTQAGKYFNAVTYTGTGSSLSVTGAGFQPDFVWIKSRSAATDHGLYDVVRGVQKQLESNNTNAETTETTGLTAFGSDGFTVGALAQLNTNTATYVAWNWKANGAGVTNTAGSITSTVSANTTSGFSVVTWTCPAGASDVYTVGHGLGAAPKMIIIKSRNGAYSWFTWHIGLGDNTTDYVALNLTNAEASSAGTWGAVGRNSSVMGFTNGVSTIANNTMVAYVFSEVPGFSKFGSYTGNGSTDGPFVYCGFRPAYVMIKASSDGTYPWQVFDRARNPSNVVTQLLLPNASDSEYTVSALDFTANGFKLRDTNTSRNNTGTTYIFAAFAEAPQKFALAR